MHVCTYLRMDGKVEGLQPALCQRPHPSLTTRYTCTCVSAGQVSHHRRGRCCGSCTCGSCTCLHPSLTTTIFTTTKSSSPPPSLTTLTHVHPCLQAKCRITSEDVVLKVYELSRQDDLQRWGAVGGVSSAVCMLRAEVPACAQSSAALSIHTRPVHPYMPSPTKGRVCC